MKLTLHIPVGCKAPEQDLKIAAFAVGVANETQQVSTLCKTVLDKLPFALEPISDEQREILDQHGPWLSAPREEVLSGNDAPTN